MILSGLSIRTAVLGAIAVAVVLPAMALWAIEDEITRRAQEPLITQGRQAVLTVSAVALVEPLWTLDDAAIDATARKIFKDPAVLNLRLTEARPDAPPRVLTKPGSQPGQGVALRTGISREGEALGELELWFDPAQIDRALAERRRASWMLTTAQVVLGSLLLLWVLTRRLIVPIGLLKRQASQIAVRGDVTPFRWRRRDELGELGRHLDDVHVQIGTLIDRLQAQKGELEKLAMTDLLTGLPNRSLFANLVQSAVSSARREGRKLALLFIDIDRFKAVNDTLGHAAGDQLLMTLAGRLRAALRESDAVSRHSGDEFTALLTHADRVEDVAATVERLLHAVGKPVPLIEGEVTVTASIGVAIFPDDSDVPDELLRCADLAMYAAKNLGRERYTFYRSEFNTQLQATLLLERQLLQALQREEFVLHFQPQVRTDTGALVGCEALIRWRHPERGLLAPAHFIGVAEQCGLIPEIGAWALRNACAHAARWRDQGLRVGPVAVNVSALEFREPRLIENLTSALAEFDLDPQALEIELTESVVMSDTPAALDIVNRLHALGLRMAVDDFGTGYSSLAYLKHLRPSKVKIDRSFVLDLEHDVEGRTLVNAIVQLAHALGISTVAEGVETEGQREILRQTGCQVLQGYLLGRPMPAADFEALAGAAGVAGVAGVAPALPSA